MVKSTEDDVLNRKQKSLSRVNDHVERNRLHIVETVL